MDQVLLATYNFYPYHWGGSEVYVASLYSYLITQKKEVRIIAAVDIEAINTHGIYWQGEYLKICTYMFQEYFVYGANHEVSTSDIYTKYRSEWQKDWENFFNYIGYSNGFYPNLLHLNGFTAVIGLALIKAYKNIFYNSNIYASYHTPISCPKGTLMKWDKDECEIKASSSICTACTWNAKTHWLPVLSQLSTAFLPKSLPDYFPVRYRWKALINYSINSFQELTRYIDHWWVFSDQIKMVLKQQGVKESSITLGRHGINSIYDNLPSHLLRSTTLFIFAFVGRFKKIKGLATLLKAWQEIPESDKKQLWLIGDKSDADQEINDILETLLSNRKDVFYLGKKTQEELVNIYKTIHVLVIPSETLEIGPLVFHEAIACGANIITSDIGGGKELAKFYSKGCYLFKVKDSSSLKEVIDTFSYKEISHDTLSQESHFQMVSKMYKV